MLDAETIGSERGAQSVKEKKQTNKKRIPEIARYLIVPQILPVFAKNKIDISSFTVAHSHWEGLRLSIFSSLFRVLDFFSFSATFLFFFSLFMPCEGKMGTAQELGKDAEGFGQIRPGKQGPSDRN